MMLQQRKRSLQKRASSETENRKLLVKDEASEKVTNESHEKDHTSVEEKEKRSSLNDAPLEKGTSDAQAKGEIFGKDGLPLKEKVERSSMKDTALGKVINHVSEPYETAVGAERRASPKDFLVVEASIEGQAAVKRQSP